MEEQELPVLVVLSTDGPDLDLEEVYSSQNLLGGSVVVNCGVLEVEGRRNGRRCR